MTREDRHALPGADSHPGEFPSPPDGVDSRDGFARAADDLRRCIGEGGGTPWGASGNRPGALMRRAYLRVLRPYLRRRAEVDTAVLRTLDIAGATMREHERRVLLATDRAHNAAEAAADALEYARRIDGRMAVSVIDAATTRHGVLDATVCTIASRATIGHAHALARSVARVHPGTTVIALITDHMPDPAGMAFTAVSMEDVLNGAAAEWRAGHEGVALEYALTPSLILYLLREGHRRLVFIKQESMVVGSLEPILDGLGTAGIGLTPHLLTPPVGPDASERLRDVMLAGTFNGGVIAVNDTSDARRALRWWESRLQPECEWDVIRGRHYEQRWLDLIPMMFDDVAILRGAGLNAGHWNIADRGINGTPGHLRAGDDDVAVLRFSGFRAEEPDVLTRYVPGRLARGLPPPLDLYLRAFREELLAGTGPMAE